MDQDESKAAQDLAHLREMVSAFYARIARGDEEHRRWLKGEFETYFAEFDLDFPEPQDRP